MIKIDSQEMVKIIRDFLQIDNTNKKLAFLVGSGVSKSQPSNLPSGQELTKAILNASVVDDAKLDLLELTDAFRANINSDNDFIRFERLIEITHKWIDPDLEFLGSLKHVGSPNRLHNLIARQLIKGDLVFTTNFDNLLEKALQAYGKDFELISTRDEAKAFRDGLSSDSRLVLKNFQNIIFKLHGTFFDKNGNDVQHTIKSTLDNLLEGSSSMSLGSEYDFIFEEAFQFTNLVVVGYSGFDDFDVMPSLRSTSSLQRILWIDHYSGDDLIMVNPENVDMVADTDRDLRQLNWLMSKLDFSSNTSVALVRANTERLLSELFGDKLSNNFKIHNSKVSSNLLFSDDLVKNDVLKYFVTGRLYHETQRYKDAIRYYEYFLEKINEDKSLYPIESQFYVGLAFLYTGMAQSRLGSNSAAKNIDKSVELFGNIQNEYYFARALQYQAAFKASNEAVKLYKYLIEFARPQNDEMIIAQAYHQLGSLEENNEQAISYYEQALDIRRRLGDIIGIASTAKQLGVRYFDAQPQQARIYFNESLKIFHALGYAYDSLEPLMLLYNLLAYILKDKGASLEVIQNIRTLINNPDVHGRLTREDKMDLLGLGFLPGTSLGEWRHSILG